MKIVNKWNRRLLRAVRRNGGGSSSADSGVRKEGDDASVGSNEEDVRINDGRDGTFTRNLPKRSRESIMNSMPGPGRLSQQSGLHLDLLHALAYPKRTDKEGLMGMTRKSSVKRHAGPGSNSAEEKVDESVTRRMADLSVVEDN